MYKRVDYLEAPEDGDQIWRYMSITKLLSLLSTRELHFSSLATLGDPYEGHLSQATVDHLRSLGAGERTEEEQQKFLATINRSIRSFPKVVRTWLYVSCWHLSDVESAAMWRLYAAAGEGVAVRSTFGRLCESFAGTEEVVRIGKVRYIDYKTEYIDQRRSINLGICKRRSYAYENELRAVVHGHPKVSPEELFASPTALHGRSIPVDLDRLIERIYVAPSAPEWVAAVVEDVVSRYAATAPVIHSDLEKGPLY